MRAELPDLCTARRWPINTACGFNYDCCAFVCSLSSSKQYQHAEGRDEDRGNACEEEAASSIFTPRTGAEEEKGNSIDVPLFLLPPIPD